MRRIWVYQGEFGAGKDFKWMSIAEFERTFCLYRRAPQGNRRKKYPGEIG